MTTPVIMWFRRDLRLGDNAALTAACSSGGPVIPVFIHDELVDDLGAAPRMRLGMSIASLDAELRAKGSRLTLRKGPALEVLRGLIVETGARIVHWSRAYDPAAIARDTEVKSALKDDGIDALSHKGHVLFEPWTVQTKTGGFYRVFTPMWKEVRGRDVSTPLPEPAQVRAPDQWPGSDKLDAWEMEAPMRRGADVMRPYCKVGERAAFDRLARFTDDCLNTYHIDRDFPAKKATSGLSENLTYGEISPAQIWHEGWRGIQLGQQGAETFLKELVWREFAYHLAFHTPHITTGNWKEGWDRFPWNTDESDPNVIAWKQGRTGIEFVDAAMREMYVTGVMHNRARMIVGSFLTKHLLTHWKVGLNWFADCLIDWDLASNAMGWQWVSGSGPDATPYFRIFNPETQLDKFDKNRTYANSWIAEGRKTPSETALSYFDAVPDSWGLSATMPYADPVVTLADGRARALSAYESRDF